MVGDDGWGGHTEKLLELKELNIGLYYAHLDHVRRLHKAMRQAGGTLATESVALKTG